MAVFSIIMTVLSALKLPVLKFVVLLGTFALAMAFAGNDLVNFVGVPLTGLDAYQDYVANGGGNPDSFLMGSLMGSAHTPAIYLLIRSNCKSDTKQERKEESLFLQILKSRDKAVIWTLLCEHIRQESQELVGQLRHMIRCMNKFAGGAE